MQIGEEGDTVVAAGCGAVAADCPYAFVISVPVLGTLGAPADELLSGP